MEPLLLSLAGAAVALYCLWQLRRWLQETQAAAAAGPQRLEALVDELLATAEATAIVVQEKAEALEAVIAQADRRIETLHRGAPAPEAAVAASVAPAPAPAEPAAPGPTPAPASAPAPEPVLPAPPASEPGQELPEIHRAVYTLYDAGQDHTAIARRLGLTKGEVQLILGLRQTQGAGREARP